MIFKKHKSSSRGFTLIELLVVVAIISLLSSIVLASLNSARMKSRNVARLSAINTIANGLNIGLGGNVSFPIQDYVCVSATCYGNSNNAFSPNPTLTNLLAIGLPQRPSDPAGGSRTDGGFLYFAGTLAQTSLLGTAGVHLVYFLEPPASCGRGTIYSPSANQVICMLKID